MIRKIQLSTEAAGTLVARRPTFRLKPSHNVWCTISPNAKLAHSVWKGRKSAKILYGNLPHKVQYEYCMRILQQCYVPFLSDEATLCGTYELNHSGNVHFHFVINDPKLWNAQLLAGFQRDIKCCDLVCHNRPRKSTVDHMNNIVRLDKDIDDVCDYMDKDYFEDMPFNTYYLDPVPDSKDYDSQMIKPIKMLFGKKHEYAFTVKCKDDEDSLIE